MMEITAAEVACVKAQHRRDARRAAGLCINGPAPGSPNQHGPIVRGSKCQACIDTHRRSK